MKLKFFVKSKTANIEKYNIKNIISSSGRLDVITRCIIAAILNENGFERNIQIWVFLDQYGTFVFDPEYFDYKIFPKKEIEFTDYFVRLLQDQDSNEDLQFNPLNAIKRVKLNLIEAILHLRNLNYNFYILSDEGQNFFELLRSIQEKEKIGFILGSQHDEFLNSEELIALKIPTISFGNQSYLASSVIRLLKLHIKAL
jgi:tRNA pseudouridine-54 N-methylase